MPGTVSRMASLFKQPFVGRTEGIATLVGGVAGAVIAATLAAGEDLSWGAVLVGMVYGGTLGFVFGLGVAKHVFDTPSRRVAAAVGVVAALVGAALSDGDAGDRVAVAIGAGIIGMIVVDRLSAAMQRFRRRASDTKRASAGNVLIVGLDTAGVAIGGSEKPAPSGTSSKSSVARTDGTNATTSSPPACCTPTGASRPVPRPGHLRPQRRR